MKAWRGVYPFCAVRGQSEAKLALCLSLICPGLGGVLLLGEKGTAKSTLARGLTELMRLGGQSGSFVDLPLNCTEDALCGCLSLEAALREARVVCQPGLLLKADGGILYIDEVNLLPDHAADLLLDAAASGEFRLEREGLSLRQESRFVLIGSMNPEEGELRPQLRERFGLSLRLASLDELDERVSILRELEAFERDKAGFLMRHRRESEALAAKLAAARQLYFSVALCPEALSLAAQLSAEALTAGQRAEILLGRAAKAHAAWQGRSEATAQDVKAVAEFVLAHRRRMPPKENQDNEQRENQEHSEPEQQPDNAESPENKQDKSESEERESRQEQQEQPQHKDAEDKSQPSQGQPTGQEKVFEIGESFKLKPITLRRDRLKRQAGNGRRAATRTTAKSGRTVGSRANEKARDLALDASLRAAAPFQRARRAAAQNHKLAVILKPGDLRERKREKRVGTLIVLVVDASSSMGAARRMSQAKAAVLSWLLDAYQKRDRVAFIAFRGEGAQVLLPPTSSPERAYRLLEELPTGGKTPLAHGLSLGYQTIENELRRHPATIPLLIIISDGRVNVALNGGKPLSETLDLARRLSLETRIKSFVVDTEPSNLNALGLAARLADALNAKHVKVEDLKARDLIDISRR